MMKKSKGEAVVRCAKCGSANITSETQPTRGYNFFGSMVVETQKTYHCMACGAIGDFSSIAMDYETEAMLNFALENNNIAKLQNFKRKYRNFEWVPPAQSNNERPSSGYLTRNVSNDPNFDISYGTLRKYNGLDKSVYIPVGVKEIGRSAFSGALQVTSVTIPTSVTKIDDSAFYDLEHLTTVVFERGTYNDKSSIEKFAFDSCRNLASIAIPNGFIVIKQYAFRGCWHLSTVILPNTLRSIEYNAFSCCFSLTSIVIPDNVTSIGSDAFSSCEQMASVTLSKNLSSIDSSAFQDCKRLKSIMIPRSVTYIGNGAFKGCKKLKIIYFEDPCGWSLKSKETTIGSVDEKILSNPKSAAKFLKKRCDDYSLCKKDNGIVKPQGLIERVETPCERPSSQNPSLESCSASPARQQPPTVEVRTPVFKIENRILKEARILASQSVKIPQGVAIIGKSAFANCENLTSVAIPDGVKSIEEAAFRNCKNLTSITIPNGVKSIEDATFAGCENLSSVTIPDSVTSIGKSAFASCKNLTSITIPNGVISIGEWAFSSCKIKSIAIPKSVTSIENNIFTGCDSLETIFVEEGNPNYRWEGNCLIRIEDNTVISGFANSKIPNYITCIGKEAFFRIPQTSSLVIPKNIIRIEAEAYGNRGVNSIVIPEKVNYIGKEAITDGIWCDILKSVIFSDPHGWVLLTEEDNEGQPIDDNILSDPESAAEFIRSHYGDSFCKK